jgi:hypothetical protein
MWMYISVAEYPLLLQVEIMVEQLHERTIGGDLQIAFDQIQVPEEDDGR